jgi:predicted metalloendopeptidase
MRRIAILTAALLAAACAPHSTQVATNAPPPAVQATVPPYGIYLNYIDKGTQPGDDFFNYASGNWVKTATIPESRSYAGINLDVDTANEAHMKEIVAELSSKPEDQLSPEERKMRDLYNAYADQKAIDAAGLAPAQADLNRIAAIKTHEDVVRTVGDQSLLLRGAFGVYIGIDQKHPREYSVNVTQGGLGLPDRDYYLKTDKDMVATQVAYKKYLVTMLGFAGVTGAEAEKRAAAIYALEKNIAEVSWPAADRRDEDKTYNPMTLSALQKFAPQYPWATQLEAEHIPATGPKGERVIIVAEKSAIPKIAAVFRKTPVSVWRDALTVRYLHSWSDSLPKNIEDAAFAFYGTTLNGQAKQLDRETRAAQLLDQTMGEALGKLYVAKYFSPVAKTKIRELVDNLLKAYAEDIKTLDWMTPETRTKAEEKLSKFTPKVGYPDTWRDYSKLDVTPGQLIPSTKSAVMFEVNRNLVRLDQPVDKAEWGMTPQTNNAEYSTSLNTIEFPAGILQPPYFDEHADDAVNYGAIGSVIGHEISHGFDDQGSKYDGDGVMQSWWTPADRANFDARTTALGKQYDAFEPLPGLHINGKLTMGENIADLAGLAIAYKAYHISLGGKPAPVLNGLTGDQRFFIAYAQAWREIWADGLTRRVVLSNPHAPSKFRVIGVVRNSDAWYAAFPQIQPGQHYYLAPDQRVKLW